MHSAYQAALAQLGERGVLRVTIHERKVAGQRNGGHGVTRIFTLRTSPDHVHGPPAGITRRVVIGTFGSASGDPKTMHIRFAEGTMSRWPAPATMRSAAM